MCPDPSVLIRKEVGINQVQQILCWVGMRRHRQADVTEIGPGMVYCSEITSLTIGQKQQLIEQVESLSRRLMDRCNND